MAEKLTKKDVVRMMLNEERIYGNPIYLAYLERELALLDKKASAKKATKTQTENEEIKVAILNTLAEMPSGGTVTEIQTACGAVVMSNQKASALLRQLVEEGKVARTMDKKKAIFSIVQEKGI